MIEQFRQFQRDGKSVLEIIDILFADKQRIDFPEHPRKLHKPFNEVLKSKTEGELVKLSMNMFYINVILNEPGRWSFEGADEVIREVLKARHEMKIKIGGKPFDEIEEDVAVIQLMKRFINGIFQQMNSGTLRHEFMDRNTTVKRANEIMRDIMDGYIDNVVWVDTDEIVFEGLDVVAVTNMVLRKYKNFSFACDKIPSE